MNESTDSGGQAIARRIADEARSDRGAEFWLEVRPYLGQDLRVVNYLNLLKMAHQAGEVFEFLAASGPDPHDLEANVAHPSCVVRYFVRCPDSETEEDAKNLLSMHGFTVEEVPVRFEGGRLLWWWRPEYWMEYPCEAELELAAPYELVPLIPESRAREREFEEFADVITDLHAALLPGGAFRMAIRADPGAGRYLRLPTQGGGGLGSASGAAFSFLDSLMRGLASLGRPDGTATGGRPQEHPSRMEQEKLEEVWRRSSHDWFVCDGRAYGTVEQIGRIERSFSFPSNRIRVFKIRTRAEEWKPLNPAQRRIARWARRRIPVLSSILLPAFAWWAGLWDPLQILKSTGDLAVLILSIAVPLVTGATVRRLRPMVGNPIVATVRELSLLLSLPADTEKGHFYFAGGKP